MCLQMIRDFFEGVTFLLIASVLVSLLSFYFIGHFQQDPGTGFEQQGQCVVFEHDSADKMTYLIMRRKLIRLYIFLASSLSRNSVHFKILVGAYAIL